MDGTSVLTFVLQLKYHDTGREKDCLPQVGQWNMMNKVIFCIYVILLYAVYVSPVQC